MPANLVFNPNAYSKYPVQHEIGFPSNIIRHARLEFDQDRKRYIPSNGLKAVRRYAIPVVIYNNVWEVKMWYCGKLQLEVLSAFYREYNFLPDVTVTSRLCGLFPRLELDLRRKERLWTSEQTAWVQNQVRYLNNIKLPLYSETIVLSEFLDPEIVIPVTRMQLLMED